MQEAKKEYLDLDNLSEAEGIDKFGSYDEYADALKDAESKAKKTRTAHERHIVPARTPDKVAATPPKEPVAEVKEMKEKPKQQNLDLTDPPKAKEEKPVEAEVKEKPKEEKGIQLLPKEAKELYAIQAELKERMVRARGKEPGSPERKAVEEKEKEKSDKMVELGFPKPPKPQARDGEGVLKGRIVPIPLHYVKYEDGSEVPYQTRKPVQEGVTTASRAAEKKAAREALATQVKPKELPVVPSPVTPEKDLKAGEATGSKDAEPSATDQKTGDGVPPPEKATESKKVLAPSTSDQANQIYTASASADNSLQALNNLPNGHPDREEYYQRYIDHRMMLSKLLEAAGHDHLLQTGNLKVLKQDHGLPKEMLQGANNYRKTQEDKNNLKFYLPDEPESSGPQPYGDSDEESLLDVDEEFLEPEDIPPKAPVQRIEPTVTPPRIESIVGSKSPLPQTQPQPQPQPQAQVPAPGPTFRLFEDEEKEAQKAEKAYYAFVNSSHANKGEVYEKNRNALADKYKAATLDAGLSWQPLSWEPREQPDPAPVAPVVPAATVPAGAAPVAPSGRGSQAASQAAAASGAKPVDQGQFAPSKPQTQPQTQAPASAAPALPDWLAAHQKETAATVPPQLHAKIEELAAQRKTAKQIAKELGLDEDQVRAVRMAMNIPPQGSGMLLPGGAVTQGEQDDKDKFEAWIKGYKSRQAGATPGTPAPAASAEATPVPQPVPPAPAPAPAPAPWFPFGQGNGQAPWPSQNDQAIPAPVPQPVPPAPAPAPPGKQPAPAPAPAQPSQQPVPGQPQQKPGTPQPKPPFNPFQRTEPTPAQPKPKPPFNPFQRIENKVAPRTSRPKKQPETQPQPQQQQPGTKTQPVPVPVPVPGKPQQQGVPQQPMSRLEKVKKALASVGQGIGQAATNASQSVQRAATHGITKAVLAHLGVAALHGINYHKAIKNLGPKQPRKFNPGWHGFTTPVGKPEDEAKAAEQQKAAPEPKEAAEPKTSGKWERRDR